MESCFPSPDHPVFSPTPEALKYRRWLRYIIYGQLYASFVKLIFQGFISGLFHLFSVWIAYNSWATMNPCYLIFQLIYSFIDILMLYSNWAYYK